jgi:F-type H+-transporting ATPase subunit epsilon
MPGKFRVELVTPEGVVLDKEVEEIIAPGVQGEFGVLVGHTPMLTFIKPGIFSYLENDRFTRFAVGPGFCEVLGDSVTVLVEQAFGIEQVDGAVVASELEELETQLRSIDPTADPDAYERISTKIKIARAKVALAGGI